jgi:predicted RNA-binding protein YlxR (DUF448 family)
MIRVVKLPDGELAEHRDAPGRGAWLCRGSVHCLNQAVRRRAFDRAFRASVEVGAVERLRSRLVEAWEKPASDVRG